MRGRIVAVVLVAGLAGGGCGVDEAADPVPTLFDDSTSTSASTVAASTETTASTTTVPIAERLPPLPDDIDGAVRSVEGFLLPILGTDGEVWNVRGACREEAVEPAVTAELVGPRHVVVDPGAAWGTDEARVLLDLARAVVADLRAVGVAAELTRTTDAALSPTTRATAAAAVGARLLVTLGFGVAAGEATETPRPAVFHQIDDAESRRAGGLLHEHLVPALRSLAAEWNRLDEVGVRPLLNQRGEDYFTVLRESGGVPAVRVELVAAGRDTTLLADEEGRAVVSGALAEAIARFLVTDESGDGYVEPTDLIRRAPTANTVTGCPE